PGATSDETSPGSTPEGDDTGSTVESPAAIAPTTSPTASPTASPTPPAEAIEFSDVPEDHWANYFIIVLSEQQIIRGFPDQSFKPNQPVTRGELAAIIQNVFDKVNTENSINFQDLPADYWASPAIDEAVKTGFMKGYPGEVFRPDEQVPRVQVLVALVSGLEATPPSTPEEAIGVYQDKEQIPQWAIEKIATATQSGLVVNHPNPESLNPNQPATRAEVAAMIYQALVISGRAEEYSSEYIISPTD
ncbi:MAG: S-layer homology domain-containing protein, partial [Symploca sp. SIO1B1]|nr:S-layer homology domain-containing protein [Symploca sp. SIO1B1]